MVSDFNLRREYRSGSTNPQSSFGHDPIAVSDLEQAFEALEEEIFLVDRNNGAILWMSPACHRLEHKLGSSKNISEFPALNKIVFAAIENSTSDRSHSRWHTQDEAWEQYIGNHQKSAISVFNDQRNPRGVWVRLKRYSDRDEYFRNYVAEQEELFNTSRSVSVGEIATTLAHELNQPLGTLLNIVNGIKSRIDASIPEAEEILQALELARKQGRFASEILLRVRSFAQARKPVMAVCDVKQLINDTLNLLDWKFQSEGVNVSFSVSDESLTVRGDSTLLQQVLVNLLRNAVESMANVSLDNKLIRIRAIQKDSGVTIEVEDSGHGIDVEKMDELFTLFRSSKPNGMGVGLNICLSFIELHQGKFWFTQNKERGSTAHILIPD